VPACPLFLLQKAADTDPHRSGRLLCGPSAPAKADYRRGIRSVCIPGGCIIVKLQPPQNLPCHKTSFLWVSIKVIHAMFVPQLGFSIEDETREAIVSLAPNIAKVSAERIQIEMVKLL